MGEGVGMFFFIALVQGLVCAFVSDYIVKGKGYDSKMYFWLGFFFSVIGIIVAAVQPDTKLYGQVPNGNRGNVKSAVQGDAFPVVITEWYEKLPFEIMKGNIFVNKDTNQAALSLKMINLSGKTIKSIYIDIECFDDTGDIIGENSVISFAYQDMSIAPNEVFGLNDYIGLPNTRVRKIAIKFVKMAFEDGSVIRTEDVGEKKKLLPLISIDTLSNSLKEAIIENIEKSSLATCMFIPQQGLNETWRCCCGSQNKSGAFCVRCGRVKVEQLKFFSEEFVEKIEQDKKEANMISLANEKIEMRKSMKRTIIAFSILGIIILSVISYRFISSQLESKELANNIRALYNAGEYDKIYFLSKSSEGIYFNSEKITYNLKVGSEEKIIVYLTYKGKRVLDVSEMFAHEEKYIDGKGIFEVDTNGVIHALKKGSSNYVAHFEKKSMIYYINVE